MTQLAGVTLGLLAVTAALSGCLDGRDEGGRHPRWGALDGDGPFAILELDQAPEGAFALFAWTVGQEDILRDSSGAGVVFEVGLLAHPGATAFGFTVLRPDGDWQVELRVDAPTTYANETGGPQDTVDPGLDLTPFYVPVHDDAIQAGDVLGLLLVAKGDVGRSAFVVGTAPSNPQEPVPADSGEGLLRLQRGKGDPAMPAPLAAGRGASLSLHEEWLMRGTFGTERGARSFGDVIVARVPTLPANPLAGGSLTLSLEPSAARTGSLDLQFFSFPAAGRYQLDYELFGEDVRDEGPYAAPFVGEGIALQRHGAGPGPSRLAFQVDYAGFPEVESLRLAALLVDADLGDMLAAYGWIR